MILLTFFILFIIATAVGLTFFTGLYYLIPVWILVSILIWALVVVFNLYCIILPISAKLKPTNKLKHFIAFQYMEFGLALMRTTYKVKGKENVFKANGRPLVIVANHKCTLDVLWAYLAMKQPMTAVAKSTLYDNRFYRPIINAYQVVTLNRESERLAAKAILQGIKGVENGLPTLIFPEGGIKTREHEQMVCVRPGAYKLATKPQAFIQPIVIRNSHTMSKRKWYQWTHVELEVLPVINPEEYKDKNTTELGLDIAKLINSNFEGEQVNVEVTLTL